MDSRAILAEHPSVQDLDIKCQRVNSAKVAYHTRRINQGPLVTDAPRNSKKEAKDQTTKVVRHEANLIAAANRPRSEVKAFIPKKTPTPAAAEVKAVESKKPEKTQTQGLPPIASKPRSTLTSVLSFEGSDAESFSVYSCSCCQIGPPSSVPTGRLTPVPSVVTNSKCSVSASAYDNMTSISQRIENHHHHSQRKGNGGSGSAVSVASTKLRELESQLQKEREDRKRTQEELKLIQERQQQLMAKLSDRERALFAEALSGPRPSTGSTQ